MSLVSAPGIMMPSIPFLGVNIAYVAMLIDATGEKAAFMGQVWTPNRGSKDITRVGFRFGTVSKGSGSGLTVSLQNVSTTAAVPLQPDETQDQTVAISNANIPASNSWYRTNALSANRTVTHGEWLAVVIEYDGSGRIGTDAINITGLGDMSANGAVCQFCSSALKTGGAWARTFILNNVILEYSDGTFGTLGGPWSVMTLPCSAQSTLNLNTGSTPDEAGLRFKLPFEAYVEGAWFYSTISANTVDFDVVLYEGTTAVSTLSVDASYANNTAIRPGWVFFSSPGRVKPNTEYTLALKPTTANNLGMAYIDVSDANHFQAMAGGTDWHWNQRTDAGAWTPTTTRRPLMGLLLSHVHDRGPGPEAILGF